MATHMVPINSSLKAHFSENRKYLLGNLIFIEILCFWLFLLDLKDFLDCKYGITQGLSRSLNRSEDHFEVRFIGYLSENQ